MTSAPSPTPALFWRWLLAGALVFAIVAQVEAAGLLRLFAELERGGILVGGVQIALTSLVAGLASAAAYALYAVIFLANYFFFQRFERVAGGRLVSLWLLASLRLAAGVFAAWLLRLIVAAVAMLVADDGSAMSGIVLWLIEPALNAAVGAGFGFLLWSLQAGHSALLPRRAPLLRRSHVLGGAIGGALLALAALALFQRHAPAAMSLAALGLAVVPHLILTWRAMRPALADGARDMTGAGVFIARLLATLAFLAVPGLAFYFLSVQ